MVVHVFEVERGEVALAVERVEMRVQRGVFPDAVVGLARAAFLRRQFDGDNLKSVAQRLERFVRENGFDRDVHIVEKRVHLDFLITFGNESDMDAARFVFGFLHDGIGRNIALADASNQNVGRHDFVRHGRGDFASVVEQTDGYIDRVCRHRNQKNILKRPPRFFGFGIRLPFLKKRRKRVAIDDFARFPTAHGDLSVSFDGQFGESDALPEPSGRNAQLVQGNDLMRRVARESIVYPQRAILEKVVKNLRPHARVREYK